MSLNSFCSPVALAQLIGGALLMGNFPRHCAGTSRPRHGEVVAVALSVFARFAQEASSGAASTGNASLSSEASDGAVLSSTLLLLLARLASALSSLLSFLRPSRFQKAQIPKGGMGTPSTCSLNTSFVLSQVEKRQQPSLKQRLNKIGAIEMPIK